MIVPTYLVWVGLDNPKFTAGKTGAIALYSSMCRWGRSGRLRRLTIVRSRWCLLSPCTRRRKRERDPDGWSFSEQTNKSHPLVGPFDE